MSLIENPKKPVTGQIIDVGTRVRTNARYEREVSPVPRAGVTVRRHAPITGCWVVQMDDIAPVQYVHENFLEVES